MTLCDQTFAQEASEKACSTGDQDAQRRGKGHLNRTRSCKEARSCSRPAATKSSNVGTLVLVPWCSLSESGYSHVAGHPGPVFCSWDCDSAARRRCGTPFMNSNSFFADLLSTIADRGRDLLGRVRRNGGLAQGDLAEACETLLSSRGEASGVALAREILTRWEALDEPARIEFLKDLAERFGPDLIRLDQAVTAY